MILYPPKKKITENEENPLCTHIHTHTIYTYSSQDNMLTNKVCKRKYLLILKISYDLRKVISEKSLKIITVFSFTSFFKSKSNKYYQTFYCTHREMLKYLFITFYLFSLPFYKFISGDFLFHYFMFPTSPFLFYILR